jgi:superfamily II DNA/RNA helicase
MSSPLAALESIHKRIVKVGAKKGDADLIEENLEVLNTLKTKLEKIITTNSDTKYKKLKETLLELGWTGKKSNDRYVIFAERIDTLKYLQQKLSNDFLIQEEAVQFFHGSLTDVEQQSIIEDFGKQDSSVRLLLCSDAGAQGVNLHFFCNRMFNYDIPWSLITLEQRNGRIDRYGQKKTPFIHYIIAESDVHGLKTDLHIVEKLTKKEEVVYKTLGDAGSVMKLYDTGKEEQLVENALLHQDENFLDGKNDVMAGFDFSTLFGEQGDKTAATITDNPYETNLTIYPSEAKFYSDLFDQLTSANQINQEDVTVKNGYLEILNTKDLNQILFDLPPESKPKRGQLFKLSLDKDLVQRSIEEARKKKGEWAEFQVLSELHPVIKYYMTKLEASVDKDVALIAKANRLPKNTSWFIFHAQVSNNLGQPVIADFLVAGLNADGSINRKPFPLNDFISEYKLQEPMHTESISDDDIILLQNNLSKAVAVTTTHMHAEQKVLEASMETKLNEYKTKIDNWRAAALQQLEIDFDLQITGGFRARIKDSRQREIETILSTSSQYYKDLTSLQGDAYLKVLAVFYNS